MSQKTWILTSIKARTEPRPAGLRDEGEYVTQSEGNRHFFGHTKLFRIKSNSHPMTYEINEEEVSFYLGEKTKRQDLEHLQMVFKAQKNIDIDYSGSSFGLNGQLLKLKLNIKDNQGGNARTSSSPFQPIRYHRDFTSGQTYIKNVNRKPVSVFN